MGRGFEETENRRAPLVRLSDTGRLEAFSDGVFSVTITLLRYEVARPDYEPGASPAKASQPLRPWRDAYGEVRAFDVLAGRFQARFNRLPPDLCSRSAI